MKDGFINAAAAIPDIRVADCGYNSDEICRLIDRAFEISAKILVFPELCLTGATCGDLFFQDILLKDAQKGVEKTAEHSKNKNILIFVGVPIALAGKLYNCCVVILNGKILGIVPKTHLPNYAEFYECRYFESAPDGIFTVSYAGQECPFGAKQIFCCEDMEDFTIGVEICEDMWTASPPGLERCENGATVIVNLSASPEAIGKSEYRAALAASQSARGICGYIYANAGSGESSGDVVYSGHSMIAENGVILEKAEPFSGRELIFSQLDISFLARERRRTTTFCIKPDGEHRKVGFSMPLEKTALTRFINPYPFIPGDTGNRNGRCEFILNMQAAALGKRLSHINTQSVVIGVSGGLDSALALIASALAFDKMGFERKNITAVTMPCFGTSQRTLKNAEELCVRMGTALRKIDITKSVKSHFEDIGHSEKKTDIVFENAQARERTQVLMDIANSTGGIVIGTGDLSELALGWSTYNGDHMSMYNINCSVPKTLVRYIVAYYADTCGDKELAAVLRDIINTPVSPELLPPDGSEITQKTQELIGSYELHDFFLYQAVRCGFTPSKILRLAYIAFDGVFDREYIKRCLKIFYKRFFSQQFKRSCMPDGVKIGSVALSPRGDWRMPSDASVKMWIDNIDKDE